MLTKTQYSSSGNDFYADYTSTTIPNISVLSLFDEFIFS